MKVLGLDEDLNLLPATGAADNFLAEGMQKRSAVLGHSLSAADDGCVTQVDPPLDYMVLSWNVGANDSPGSFGRAVHGSTWPALPGVSLITRLRRDAAYWTVCCFHRRARPDLGYLPGNAWGVCSNGE